MYAIVDVRGGRKKPVIKSKNFDLIKEVYPAYSRGWGHNSGFIIASI